jgi:hypothetical protein
VTVETVATNHSGFEARPGEFSGSVRRYSGRTRVCIYVIDDSARDYTAGKCVTLAQRRLLPMDNCVTSPLHSLIGLLL